MLGLDKKKQRQGNNSSLQDNKSTLRITCFETSYYFSLSFDHRMERGIRKCGWFGSRVYFCRVLQFTVCTVIQKCNFKHLSIYPFDMSAILDLGRSHVLRTVYLKLTTNYVWIINFTLLSLLIKKLFEFLIIITIKQYVMFMLDSGYFLT